jgi:hypothetical protein
MVNGQWLMINDGNGKAAKRKQTENAERSARSTRSPQPVLALARGLGAGAGGFLAVRQPATRDARSGEWRVARVDARRKALFFFVFFF